MQIKTKKGKPRDPAKVEDCRAKPDGWFEYTKVVPDVPRVASVRDFAPCHTRVARIARSARSADVPLVPPLGAPPPCYACCAFCRSKRTGCVPGSRAKKKREEDEDEEASTDDGDEEEEEETENEVDDEPLTPHGKKQARGTVKKEHSEDEPEDTVVPEKHSSSSTKAARSTVLEVKQEPQTMAEKKKRKSEERSPPKVPPRKSEAEMPKKKKDKDKPARGNVSFAIGGKGPHKSINAAPTRAEKFQHEDGYDRDLDTMQRILQTDFNATVGRLVIHYKDCLSEEPKSR